MRQFTCPKAVTHPSTNRDMVVMVELVDMVVSLHNVT